MDYTDVFTYNANNLLQTTDNVTLAAVLAIIFLIAIILIRFVFLLIVGIFLLKESEKKIQNRKKLLSDLVLMRDVQTELEKEIEQATLKAAFQN